MPPYDPRELQWLKIDDFSPGVADRDFTSSGTIGPWPPGTAVAQQTFRCRALPNGALGPLPSRATSFPLPFTYPSVAAGRTLLIVGFLIQGRVDGTASGGYDEANWIFGTEYILNGGVGANVRQFDVHRIRMWDVATPRDIIRHANDAFATGVHRPVYLESSRSAPAGSPTTPGTPVLIYAWWGDAADDVWEMWPNPSSPTSNTPLSISAIYNNGPMIVYQGRSLVCHRQSYNMASAAATWQTNEMIFFTQSNSPTISSLIASLFTPEDPGEIMGLCVSAANELFVLKYRHGAYVIRGDIVFPTVLRVPGIAGAGKMPQIPLASPIGVVYQSKGVGMHVWPGGETSEWISPQLEAENFEYNLSEQWAYGEFGGRMEFHEGLIFVPPHWVFDINGKSWWRLEDPADTSAPNGYLYFQKSINPNSVIAMRGEVASGENYAFAYNFDIGASSYQWRSQPISVQTDEDITVREVVIRATGAAGSTVFVQLIVRGASEGHTFTLDGSTYPRLLMDNSAIQGGDIQVHIEASGGANVAPIVYEVRLGYEITNAMPEGLGS